MITEPNIRPEALLVAKPADFEWTTGYAIFADCSYHFRGGELCKDERFICGIVPADAHPIAGAAEHVIRAMNWLKGNPEDPRVAEIDPPIDRISFRQRRVWHALRGTASDTSRILVSKTVTVWRMLEDVESLDEPWMRTERTEKEHLDERDAWTAFEEGAVA